jgi:K+-sensing histidine kinase KdpD
MDLNTYAVTILTERYDALDDEEKQNYKNEIDDVASIADFFENNILDSFNLDKHLLNAIMNTINWEEVFTEVSEYIQMEENK